MSFTLKENDTRPLFVVVLKDNMGEVGEAPVNLTTASTALFNMRAVGGAVKVSLAGAAITSAAAGEVTYSWGTADVDTAGEYEAEVQITWNDTKKETFPNDSYFSVSIVDDIA